MKMLKNFGRVGDCLKVGAWQIVEIKPWNLFYAECDKPIYFEQLTANLFCWMWGLFLIESCCTHSDCSRYLVWHAFSVYSDAVHFFSILSWEEYLE